MGNPRWKSFRIKHLETDLWIAVDGGRKTRADHFTLGRVIFYRNILDAHIKQYPDFLTSLVPLSAPPDIHSLAGEMYEASAAAGTGPMSAVAGTLAEYICNDLLNEFGFGEVVVENGGDLFMKLESPSAISVYAGSSPLSEKIGLEVKPSDTPLAVCCSSGTIGHSFSFGKADACMIACRSGARADAYATAFCNKVKDNRMISEITEMALKLPDVLSVVIIKDDKVGVGGAVKIIINK